MLALDRIGALAAEYDNILMAEYGWMFPAIPSDVLSKIISIHKSNKNNKREKIDSLIVDAFDNNRMNRILMSWKNETLEDYYPFLEDAIKCHISGCYFSAILTTTTQIEKIVVNNQSRLFKKDLTQSQIRDEMKSRLKNFANNENDSHRQIDNSIEIYIGKYLCRCEDEIEHIVNRNIFAHGMVNKYPSEAKSLNLKEAFLIKKIFERCMGEDGRLKFKIELPY